MATDTKTVEAILDRRLEAVFPSRSEVVKRLSEENGLRVYLGIDPTGPLHIGHVIPVLFLNDLRRIGHKPVILIGDFTATIGDPTDKEKARTALTEEQVRHNMQGYLDQLKRFLPEFDVEYNSKWLKPMSLGDVVRLASGVTVQQMLARDMFQERLKAERPIYLHEFLYPLMQGYDSVAMEIDGEVGGNDQTFNMLVGRDLARAHLHKDKLVFATKLLADPQTGKKMSKTEDNFIALSDSPQEIRRKILNFPDALTPLVFQLCTDVDLDSIPKDAREAKEYLSDELVRLIHGEAATNQAREPVTVPPQGTLAQSLKEWGAASSMSEAKNLITGGGVVVNDQTVIDWNYKPASGDRVQVGKGKFYQVS